MKNLKNTKYFIMFLSGILFSAFTVFAAIIPVNTDLTQDAVQYLQKLVLTNSDWSTTWVVLDGTNNKVMSDTICDTNGDNCKSISELITGVDLSDYLTGSALESYLSGTDSFLTWYNWKWCVMSGSQIACTEDEPTWWTSLWETGYSDNIYYNGLGEVGIGTANPWSSVKLTVNWGAKFGGELYLDSTLNDSSEIASEEPIKFSNYLWSSIITMIINTSSWYVGIGTNFPEEKLSIKSNEAELFSLTREWKRPRWFAISNEWRLWIYEKDWSTDPERFSVSSGGNVGIGTESPQSKLHVDGTIQAGDNLKIYGNTFWYIESNNQLRFNTNWSTTKMTIDNDGNVGIGTATPQTKLHVDGWLKLGDGWSCEENDDLWKMEFISRVWGDIKSLNICVISWGNYFRFPMIMMNWTWWTVFPWWDWYLELQEWEAMRTS